MEIHVKRKETRIIINIPQIAINYHKCTPGGIKDLGVRGYSFLVLQELAKLHKASLYYTTNLQLFFILRNHRR